MSLTLLFDLDDTLLDTNMDVFIPAYFQALGSHIEDRVAPEVMARALVRGFHLMNGSEDPTHILQEIFEADFYERLGIPKADLLDTLEDFYDHVFPAIGVHTKQRPEAVPLMEWAFSQGYRVAIATDPLFSRKATYQRLLWAGFDPAQFELISTFDNFHFTKTNSAYYAEVLGQLGWPDGPVLMVGNDVQRDLVSANKLGLKTYFIDDGAGSGAESFDAAHDKVAVGRGRLGDLRPWLESIDLATLTPSYTSRDAILSIMLSTPAVLQSLSLSLSENDWRHEPTRNDWAMNEIVCHLRDTEREIHTLQINLMLERADAFIPRPDTSVWASEREYLNIDGVAALAEFASARLTNLEALRKLDESTWSRKARHAIFGPTNFLEVLGFMANHDQMHIQQAWKTLQNL